MSDKMVVVPDLMPEWLRKYDGIMSEINRQLARGLENPGTGLNLDQLQVVVEHRNPFTVPVGPSAPLADWWNLSVPERREGFDRLIVVAAGITIQQVYDRCASLFTCWKYTDANLDEAVPTNDRMPANGSYAVWVRDRVEADEELKNLSANDLKQRGTAGITLLERLLMELKYFRETGKHLDVRNRTLCAGSRGTDGIVPGVHWHPDYRVLLVCWFHSVGACGVLRSREVVP